MTNPLAKSFEIANVLGKTRIGGSGRLKRPVARFDQASKPLVFTHLGEWYSLRS